MASATYDDVNLILRLYELRRDEKMRQARQWMAAKFKAGAMEEFMKLCPPGSEENAYFRMVTSYWEMVASFVTSGVLNQDLFLQSGLELLFVWERIRELIPHMRAAFKNPKMAQNMEKVAHAAIAYMGPDAYAAFAARVSTMPTTGAAPARREMSAG